MPPCSAMNAPAMSSSSPVVIPGRRCSPTCAIVAATRSPARAIRSISSGPLRMIMRRALPSGCDLGEDVVDAPARVERNERPGVPVALDDRLCLLVVDRESARHHLRRVVAARLRRCARPSMRCVAVSSSRSKKRTVSSGPSDRPRSISSSASAWTRLRGKPSSTNPSAASSWESRSRISAIVSSSGTSSPEARIGADLAAELRPVGDRGAEHVARRDVGDAVGSGDPLRLRALPGSLRAEDEDVDGRYLRKPS